MNLDNFIVNKSISLKEACIKIQLNDSRAVVVVENGKLFGLVSEGDILRAFIDGASPSMSIQPYINISPVKLDFEDPNRQKFFFSQFINGITIIPTVKENGELIGVLTILGEFRAS